MMRIRLRPVLGSLVLGGALAAAACSRGDVLPSTPPSGGRGGAANAAVPVTTAIVAEKAIPLEIGVIGTVEAFSTVSMRAQLTGELTSVTFKEGDDVKKGQVLFTLDRRPLESGPIEIVQGVRTPTT